MDGPCDIRLLYHTGKVLSDDDSLEMAAGILDERFPSPQLHRSWHLVENYAESFCALDFIGSVRLAIFLGLLTGGPAAIWFDSLVFLHKSVVFMMFTAAVLVEICSALSLSGSIYIWAAKRAGPKYARFFGFIVAWWACTAWMTFTASNFSQLTVWGIDFPGGLDSSNIKWRALVRAISEVLLVISVTINYLPPKLYSDFFLCLIWLPIGVSYGFRDAHEVFTMSYNGTGASAGWHWFYRSFTAGTMIGFDASGHIAEETKHASIFVTIITIIGLISNTSVAIVAASRLLFAVARDGLLPLSGYIGKVTVVWQPRNAVTVLYIFSASILCTILSSSVAFTSLVSAAGVFYVCAFFSNGLVFAVMISPFYFPIDAGTFNFACIIFGSVTIFGIVSWSIVPEEKWLRCEQALKHHK
ncbi:hypothetical protein C8R42DRAFT_696714 [Lentinula raphanica]|nr:hypothetical protein C8R42DRAFT_696714 [Lentinula raphanica]